MKKAYSIRNVERQRACGSVLSGDMSQKRILITGASAGIGRDAAKCCAALGWEVYAAARRVSALETLRAQAGDGIRPIQLDVNDPASIERARVEILEQTGGHGVDGLVNNAGIALAGALADVTDAELRAQFETNVFGLMSVTRAFLPLMMARREGRIVNISSSGGLVSLPFVGAYHATKFALEALSDALRWELAPFAVRVSLIEPGPIRSEFGDKLVSSAANAPKDSAYASFFANADRIKAFAERSMLGSES